MADAKVPKGSDELKILAPEFVKLTQELLFGDIWNHQGLSQRDFTV